LIASKHKNSGEFIKITANPAQGKGGVSFGDSGGQNSQFLPPILEIDYFVQSINGFTDSYKAL
jgi:hypothetical protein